MSIRKLSTALTRLNNYLPYLPDATETSKFSEAELIEILEFSLPNSWRAKMDVENFIPLSKTRKELVEKCEAFERNPPATPQKPPAKGKPRTPKHKNGKHKPQGDLYCSIHGRGNHSSAECRTLKARKKAEGNKKPFNKAAFQKEINAMSIQQYQQPIENFTAVLKEE